MAVETAPERVYVMRDGGFIKIGRSVNVQRRLMELQTSSPRQINIAFVMSTLDAPKLEAELHRYFAKYAVRGEWFKVSASRARKEIQELIHRDKIDAFILPEIDEDKPLISKTCKWCGEGFFCTDVRQEFCDNPNHRVYWSKQRTKKLMELWEEVTRRFFNWDTETSRLVFDRDAAWYLATELGFFYDDQLRRFTWDWDRSSFVRIARKSQRRDARSGQQTSDAQTARRTLLASAHSAGS